MNEETRRMDTFEHFRQKSVHILEDLLFIEEPDVGESPLNAHLK